MKSFLIAIITMLIYGCNNNSNEKTLHSADDFALAIPKDTNTLYYPINTLFFVPDTTNKESDLFIKSIYSKILFNLKVPVLYNYKGNGEVVRLLWVRAFDNPVVIMANKRQDGVYINIKELEKKFYSSDSFLYRKKIDTTFTLPVNKKNDVFSDIKADNFFSLYSYNALDNDNYKDATMWVLEAYVKGKYHCINRIYLDTLSLKPSTAKKLYDIGNGILSMRNSR